MAGLWLADIDGLLACNENGVWRNPPASAKMFHRAEVRAAAQSGLMRRPAALKYALSIVLFEFSVKMFPESCGAWL